MDIKGEQITYFNNESEKELDLERIELIQRVNDLGLKRQKVERKRNITATQKEAELKTIDNEANYYISKINSLTERIYGVRDDSRKDIETIAAI